MYVKSIAQESLGKARQMHASSLHCPFRNPDPGGSRAKMDDRGEIDNGAAAACPKDLPDDIFIRLFLRSLAARSLRGKVG